MSNKTTITKTVRKVDNLGQYETLTTEVSYQQEIEWDDDNERKDKSSQLMDMLMDDLEDSRDEAHSKLNTKVKNTTEKNPTKRTQEDIDRDLEELGLDSLD